MTKEPTYKVVILNTILKKLMDDKKISASGLSKRTGVLIDSIELILNKDRQHYDINTLSVVIFICVATYFEVTIDYLLYGESHAEADAMLEQREKRGNHANSKPDRKKYIGGSDKSR